MSSVFFLFLDRTTNVRALHSVHRDIDLLHVNLFHIYATRVWNAGRTAFGVHLDWPENWRQFHLYSEKRHFSLQIQAKIEEKKVKKEVKIVGQGLEMRFGSEMKGAPGSVSNLHLWLPPHSVDIDLLRLGITFL